MIKFSLNSLPLLKQSLNSSKNDVKFSDVGGPYMLKQSRFF